MAAGDMVIKGTAGLIEQPKQRRFTRAGGWYTVRRWEGDPASLLAKEE